MSHDSACELADPNRPVGCRCASRAYAADPLAAHTLPVVGVEGVTT